MIALVVLGAVRPAPADLSGRYAGRVRLARRAKSAAVSAALAQAGPTLSGTLTLEVADPLAAGDYVVSGRARRRTFDLRGTSVGGSTLTFRGRVGRNGRLRGTVRVRTSLGRLRGAAVLAPGGARPTCGSAYFADTVMPAVMTPICATCHVAGGVAQATSFRVTAGDPRATEASALAFVEPTAPAVSRILEKPLGHLPHGGGQRIAPGSTEEQVLRQWVERVSAPACEGGGGGGGSGGAGGTTGAELYASNCASCHGADARGVGGRPDIHCSKQIAGPVRAGRGANGEMPAFPNLTDADIAAVQAFLDGLCPIDSASGAELYASSCASCHGSGAAGGRNADGARGPDVRCKGTDEFLEKVTRGDGRMPAFPELPAPAIRRIADYVHGFCTGGIDD
jgi:mono/diheme cytochrome c family protein